MASAVALTLYTSSSIAETESTHGLGGEPYYKNVIGVFAGVAHADRRGNELALGLEYERRISDTCWSRRGSRVDLQGPESHLLFDIRSILPRNLTIGR